MGVAVGLGVGVAVGTSVGKATVGVGGAGVSVGVGVGKACTDIQPASSHGIPMSARSAMNPLPESGASGTMLGDAEWLQVRGERGARRSMPLRIQRISCAGNRVRARGTRDGSRQTGP